MKKECMFLITRLNGKVVDVTPIEEIYTHCSVVLEAKHLTDDDIKKFYSYMDNDYIEKKIHSIAKSGRLYEEQEAKDLTRELSQYTIKIEYKEIEFN